jgi:flagellar protein FlgJ
MLRPDLAGTSFPRADFDVAPEAPSAAAAVDAIGDLGDAGTAGGDFGGVFAQVRSEVEDFLANGGGATTPSSLSVTAPTTDARAAASTDAGATPAQQQAFLSAVEPWAQEAGRRLDVAPRILAAQAALESGWGRHPLKGADGSDTHNLFGIKAGAGWQGDAVDAATTEYAAGTPVASIDRFRAYGDAAGSFHDLADLVSGQARYQGAMHAGTDARAYAQGLARGGYATDPAYADKLVRLASRLQGGD